jgi:hypothetical protein
MPDKNMVPTLLIAVVVLGAVVAKLSITARPPLIPRGDFAMFILNTVLFVFPLLAVGTLRAKKKQNVVIPSIIVSLFAGIYFFLFWFINQRGL